MAAWARFGDAGRCLAMFGGGVIWVGGGGLRCLLRGIFVGGGLDLTLFGLKVSFSWWR